MYFIRTLACGNVIELSAVLASLYYHSSQTETATLNVRGASEFIQKATQQNKLKHMTRQRKTNEKQRRDKWK